MDKACDRGKEKSEKKRKDSFLDDEDALIALSAILDFSPEKTNRVVQKMEEEKTAGTRSIEKKEEEVKCSSGKVSVGKSANM